LDFLKDWNKMFFSVKAVFVYTSCLEYDFEEIFFFFCFSFSSELRSGF